MGLLGVFTYHEDSANDLDKLQLFTCVDLFQPKLCVSLNMYSSPLTD